MTVAVLLLPAPEPLLARHEADGAAGLGEIRRSLVAQREMWQSQSYEPQEFIPVGTDRVVVQQKIVSVGRDGIEVVARTANLFTLQGGKVTQLKSFQSKAEALEAAGLRE